MSIAIPTHTWSRVECMQHALACGLQRLADHIPSVPVPPEGLDFDQVPALVAELHDRAEAALACAGDGLGPIVDGRVAAAVVELLASTLIVYRPLLPPRCTGSERDALAHVARKLVDRELLHQLQACRDFLVELVEEP